MSDLNLCDSDTGQTLEVEKTVTIGDATLLYTTARRGRIVQIARGYRGCVRIHYFYEDQDGQRMIRDDEDRNGVTLDDIIANSPEARPTSGA